MICEACKKEMNEARFCPYCGAEQSSHDASQHKKSDSNEDGVRASGGAVGSGSVAGSVASSSGGSAAAVKQGMSSAQKALIISASLCATLVLLVIIGVATAVHWTKVDVSEHKETFHLEKYSIGYDVIMDNDSPCYVGQDWTDCINRYVDEYNDSCAKHGYPLQVEEGTLSANLTSHKASHDLCKRYGDMIDDMKSKGRPGYYVASLGDWGHLSAKESFANERVSNNDYAPAVTHEAVCYFGFLGECDFSQEAQ